MNLWTMIVLIVAIVVIGDIIKARSSKNAPEKTDKNSSAIISHLKNRIENLETIVLERDRKSRFAGVD